MDFPAASDHAAPAPVRVVDRLFDACPYVAFIGALFFVLPVTPDDAFITLRYARNLLAGNGPVFNVGEHVEGFSSPLHLILDTALLAALGPRNALFGAKLMSAVFAVVMLAQMRGLARRAGLRRGGVITAQLLVVLNVNFAISSVNGLETTLYGALVLAACARFIDECEQRKGNVSAALLFACVLTRPDAMLLFALFALLRVSYVRRGDFTFRSLATWFLWFCVPFAALLACRYA